jgi:hypothetical protein
LPALFISPPAQSSLPVPCPMPFIPPQLLTVLRRRSHQIIQTAPSLYSSSGFDLLRFLARVVHRPHPNIFLGPVDLTCSFILVDIHHYDSSIAQPFAASPDTRNTRSFSETVASRSPPMGNCITFNGPDHAVTGMGKRVEEVFDKQVKQMPAALEVSLVSVSSYPF